MPNNYLSVLYKHIHQVENKNVGLNVCVWGGGEGTNIPFPPPIKSAPPPASYASDIYLCMYVSVRLSVCLSVYRSHMFLRTYSCSK